MVPSPPRGAGSPCEGNHIAPGALEPCSLEAAPGTPQALQGAPVGTPLTSHNTERTLIEPLGSSHPISRS